MNPLSSFIVFTICMIPFLIATQGSSNQNFIDSTCRNLSANNPFEIDYEFCTNTLQAAFPAAKQNATLQELGLITIQLVSRNVTDTKHHIKYLLSSQNLDPVTKQSLLHCLDLFSRSVHSVRHALTFYKTNRFRDAILELGPVRVAATCQDDAGVAIVLQKREEDAFQLATLAETVVTMVKKMTMLV